MKSLTIALFSFALLSQSLAFAASLKSVSQKLYRLYGVEAGDIGLPCDRDTGEQIIKGNRENAVPCMSAYFRTSDPAQIEAYRDAFDRFDARKIDNVSALAQIDGIWVYLVLEGDTGPQPGATVHN